ncbi:hypothetical protein AMATHDRAFT_76650 [Amanita thiersii Skay4041]|uniref:Glycoside hydrolase family 65 protein n=1 Tax=Amanita thiersii Skay4041 TaxID=703135 RepID=A0A2A9NLF7_9AGAR|nr:hypothetical protein AMATHDRAFT_76650 [Amanita thiersii Skay4041]
MGTSTSFSQTVRLMNFFQLITAFLCIASLSNADGSIDRRAVVQKYNPIRTATGATTPMQVGNSDFAFEADVTGLQTLQPFAIMSSWGWKNDSLPPGTTMEDVENYRGVSWLNHRRSVQYDFGGGGPIEQWLISNPNRVNLGRIGLIFFSTEGKVEIVDDQGLTNIRQELDLWTGILTSTFMWDGVMINVQTASAQTGDTIGISIQSSLFDQGRLGVILDYPWNDGKSKFSAPYVGNWNATANHTTSLGTPDNNSSNIQSIITHDLDAARFYTSIFGDQFTISRNSFSEHRYTILPRTKDSIFRLSVSYSRQPLAIIPPPQKVLEESTHEWEKYWTKSGFIDVLTGSSDARAQELQRRIILSRYLMRVNEAGDNPPQESGLVDNGWCLKFHMEMYFWHSAHWALWNNWDLLHRSSSIYSRFLPGSIERARVQQRWPMGARLPKMTDPSGRSAPGEINNLLIWQQPHPLVFAEYEYRAFPNQETLTRWENVVEETANWMVAFAWYNETTHVYDLGPPLFVATAWSDVRMGLAKLPIIQGTYAVYEGIEDNFWDDPAFTSDHPTLVDLHGWLPPTDGLDLEIAKSTAEKVWIHWNITDCWGWDFPMLAMSAARNGETDNVIDWLLHPLFKFDDVGMPIGGVRVPTPYFPGSGALLLAVAMMAKGWDGAVRVAPGFPSDNWVVRTEGISRAL